MMSGQEAASGLWMRPVQRFQEFLTEMTNSFAVCRTTDVAKSIGKRCSSFSGLFDWVTTTAMGVVLKVANANVTKDNKIGEALWSYINDDESCASSSRHLGRAVSLMLNTQVPNEFYAEQLTFNLKEEMGVKN